jgi:hypothetical protein
MLKPSLAFKYSPQPPLPLLILGGELEKLPSFSRMGWGWLAKCITKIHIQIDFYDSKKANYMVL